MKYCITVCYHKIIDIDTDGKSQRELNHKVEKATEEMRAFMLKDRWNEDEFEIIKDD